MTAAPGTGGTLLVAEDDPGMCTLIVKQLRAWGFEVLAARDGRAAWSLFSARPDIDLVVSDWQMPEMDGAELLRRVKATPRGRLTPFVLLTARNATDDVVTGLEAGADEYVTKPFEFKELRARVATLLKMKALQVELAEKNRRLEGELRFAQKVQRRLLDQVGALPDGVQFAVRYRPSQFLSGDCYDLVALGPSRTALYLGDVAGHGAGSALVTVMMKRMLAERAGTPLGAAGLLADLNRELLALLEPEVFIQACLLVHDRERGRLTYANAGQNRQLLVRRGQGRFEPLEAREGALLGLFEDARFDEATVPVAPGDLVVLYTDGILGATGLAEPELLERLGRAALASPDGSPAAVLAAIERELLEGPPAGREDDDQLLLVASLAGTGPAAARTRVLLVEDDPTQREVLVAALSSEHECEAEATGEAAVARLESAPYDLLVTDRMLPGGISGEEIVRRARALHPRMPVVLITGQATPESVLESFREGVAEYLRKPFDVDVLLATTRRLLAAREPASGLEVGVARQDWLEITAPSHEAFLGRFRRFSELLYATSLDPRTQRELRLAVEEMGKNALEWGNRGDLARKIRITFCIFADKVVFKIEDEGEGFRPESVSNPLEHLLTLGQEREAQGKRIGGFGIHLVKSIMDEVIYSEKGNVVLCTKYLPGPSH